VAIIGIGNPMRQDDGVGPAVVEACRADPIAGCELVQLDGETTRLLEAWRDRELAIVIDAISTGAAPGTIHDLGIAQITPTRRTDPRASSHSGGLAAAVELGAALDRLPDTLRVVGIEAGALDHGSEMSGPVAESLPTLVQLVRGIALIDAGGVVGEAPE